MRAAADQIDAIEILKAIPRPKMQQLSQVVCQAKGRPTIDLVAMLPVVRRHDPLVTDAPLHVPDADLLQLPQHPASESRFLLLPVDVGMLMGDGSQYVERAAAGRGQRRVSDAGVVRIEGR